MKRSYLISTVLFILAFLAPTLSIAGASFAVAPNTVSLDLSKPQTTAFYLKNTGNKLIHLRIKPVFYRLNSNELKAGESLLTAKKEQKQSLLPYILISPQAVSLKPQQKQEIRVSVSTPRLKPGTYRAHVLIKMLEVKQYKSQVQTSTNKIGVELNFLMQIAAAVYGTSGSGQPDLHFTCDKSSTGYLVLHTKNTSAFHFSSNIFGSVNKQQVFKQHAVIFRQSKRTITTSWKPHNIKKVVLKWRTSDSNIGTLGVAQCKIG
jgi:hypothetical protein